MAEPKKFEIKIVLSSAGTGAQDAARDLKKLGGKTEEAGHAAHEAGIKHGDLHKILHLIGTVGGPAAGAGITAVTAALTGGGIALGILAIKQLMEALSELKQKSDEAALAVAEVWIARREAAEQLIETMDRVNEKQNSNNAAFADEKRVLDAIIELRKKALGQSDLAGEASKVALDQSQLDRLKAASPGLDKDVNETRAALEDIGEHLPSLAGRDEAKLRATANQFAHVNIPQLLAQAENVGSSGQPGSETARQVILEQVDAAKKARAALAQFEEDREEVLAHQKLKAELDRAIAAREANNAAINDQTRAIKTGGSVLGIHQATAALAPAALDSAFAGFSSARSGGAVTIEQRGNMNAFIGVERAMGNSDANIVRLVELIINGQVARDKEVARLTKLVENQNKTNGN